MVDFSKELAIALLESEEEYPVDLDDAWQWLGYSTKQKARNKLEENFKEGIDYTINQMVKRVEGNNGGGSTRYNEIRLTIEAFKMMGMMTGTEKGREIRLYFLECEKAAKQKNLDELTELEGLAIAFNRMAEQKRQLIEHDRKLKQAEARLTAIECEQGRYTAPGGNKYTILGFANKHGLELSAATAGQKGKKASSLCRQKGVEVERIYDPRFGKVGLYPESILIEVFK